MFTKSKDKRDGLRCECKACEKKYREDNIEKFKAKDKKRWLEHSDSKKKYEQDTKVHIAERKRLYRKAHRPEMLEKYKIYYEANKERLSKSKSIYYEANKETMSVRIRKYQRANKERYSILHHKYIAKRNHLNNTLTLSQWQTIKQDFDNRCCYCGKEKKLTQEHFIAVNKLGEFTNNNIICACQSCNSSKQDKDFFSWYPTFKYYNKNREKIILKYLRYENNNQQLTLTL